MLDRRTGAVRQLVDGQQLRRGNAAREGDHGHGHERNEAAAPLSDSGFTTEPRTWHALGTHPTPTRAPCVVTLNREGVPEGVPRGQNRAGN